MMQHGKKVKHYVIGKPIEAPYNFEKLPMAITARERQLIAQIVVFGEGDRPALEATGFLFAAAPDLLAACKAALPLLQRIEGHKTGAIPEEKMVLLAIRKAEGKA